MLNVYDRCFCFHYVICFFRSNSFSYFCYNSVQDIFHQPLSSNSGIESMTMMSSVILVRVAVVEKTLYNHSIVILVTKLMENYLHSHQIKPPHSTVQLLQGNSYVCEYTVKFPNFRTPENFAVIYLRFKKRGKTFGYFFKKTQME